jgi:4-amino-4-deoxy-L-arabinose transferase-like glycosyltransferase
VPLIEPDEGRYSEIPREMLQSGDFVTPRLNGVLYFEKPPLYYWSVAASFAVLGLNEQAARLPTRIATLGLVALAWAFARKRWGERAGLLAALITATSTLVVGLARISLIDPSLALAMTGAAFAFAAFQEHEAAGDARRARRALYGLHVSCAAAVMLKGLVGIVLPGGAIVIWALLMGRLRLIPRLFAPGPLLVFVALTVPWHVLVARRNPDFLQFYFVHEHFQRFATKAHRRPGSPFYFVGVRLGGFLPWTAFLPRAAELFPGKGLARLRANATPAFLLVFSAIVFLFFSASKSKLVPYVQPIWVPIAVLAGAGLDRALARGAALRIERTVTAVFLGALLAFGLAFGAGGGYVHRFGIDGPAGVILGALFAGFVLMLWPKRLAVVPAIAVPWLGFVLGAVLAFPAVARVITPWPVVETALRELRPGEELWQRGHFVEVMAFYLKRKTPVSDLGWSELDFGRAHPHEEGLFPGDAEFVKAWNGPKRMLVLTHADHLRNWGDPRLGLTPPVILARENNLKHFLLANR